MLYNFTFRENFALSSDLSYELFLGRSLDIQDSCYKINTLGEKGVIEKGMGNLYAYFPEERSTLLGLYEYITQKHYL